MATILDGVPVVVQTKTAWNGGWVTRPNVEPIDASIMANDIGHFRFRVRYGDIKHPNDSTFSVQSYTSIQNEWVRVLHENQVLWQGRITVDSRNLHGNDGNLPSGEQVFTAYDGTHLLGKRDMTGSTFVSLTGTGFTRGNGVLPFNAQRNADYEQKNRSALKRTGYGGFDHYVFGFDSQGYNANSPQGETWTVKEAAKYVIAEWMNGPYSIMNQPRWTIGGMIDSAVAEAEPINYGQKTTCLGVLESLFRKEYGWGFVIVPTPIGFEFRPFTLTALPLTFGGYTIPANPNVVNINPTLNIENYQVRIERNHNDNYGKIIVQGRPMIICRSFTHDPTDDDSEILNDWNTTERTAYQTETGTTRYDKDDKRRHPKYEHIYQRFVARAENDRWTADHVPTVKTDGTLNKSTRGAIQLLDKGTLDWLPIFDGVDYTVDPPVSTNKVPRLLRPFAAVQDTDGGYVFTNRMTDDIDFEVLPAALGIQFGARLPHVMGYGRFEPATYDTGTAPVYDTREMVFTVAFEADQRLFVEYEFDPSHNNSDGVKVIQVNDAHLWYMAPKTLLPNNEFTPDGAGNGIELRNDKGKLEKIMAGAIVRYGNPRSRAQVSAKGIVNWLSNLGAILGVVGDGTDVNEMLAPITTLSWRFESTFESTFKTGHR